MISISFFIFVSPVCASDIERHAVYLDVVDVGRESPVYSKVEISFSELTSNDIYYLVLGDIVGLSASDSYGQLECGVKSVVFGSEITCKPNTENKTDYNVTFEYSILNMQSQVYGAYHLNYIYSFMNPTDNFLLEITLPEGKGIVEKSERLNPLYPLDVTIGTDGRRIKVVWDVNEPTIGSTKSFTVMYEDMEHIDPVSDLNTKYLIGLAAVFLMFIILVIVLVRRGRHTSSDKVLSLFRGSEKKVLDIIIGCGGECVQRQIVSDTGYSKAKVSRIIYDLAERGIVEKIQMGRTNIVKLLDETLKKKKKE